MLIQTYQNLIVSNTLALDDILISDRILFGGVHIDIIIFNYIDLLAGVVRNDLFDFYLLARFRDNNFVDFYSHFYGLKLSYKTNLLIEKNLLIEVELVEKAKKEVITKVTISTISIIIAITNIIISITSMLYYGFSS